MVARVELWTDDFINQLIFYMYMAIKTASKMARKRLKIDQQSTTSLSTPLRISSEINTVNRENNGRQPKTASARNQSTFATDNSFLVNLQIDIDGDEFFVILSFGNIFLRARTNLNYIL